MGSAASAAHGGASASLPLRLEPGRRISSRPGGQEEEQEEELIDLQHIVLNVGGQIHRTMTATLLSKPNTRLYHLATHHRKLDVRHRKSKEYFFDRNPEVFSSVIDYYRTGELHIPPAVCSTIIQRELAFWRIDDGLVEACCFLNYYAQMINQEMLTKLNSIPMHERMERALLLRYTGIMKLRLEVWRFLCRPKSSLAAKLYSFMSLVVVIMSISSYCLESMSEFRQDIFMPASCNATHLAKDVPTEPKSAFVQLERICTVFFTIEFFLCLLTAPRPISFLKHPITIIDLLSVLPYYAMLIAKVTDECAVFNYEYLTILRVLRILRLFHVVVQFEPIRVLWLAIMESGYELIVMFIYFIVCLVMFGSAIYLAERSTDDTYFINIPIGFWWTVITLTSVGYGDMYPQSAGGYAVGGLCAMTGTILLSLTIPVISSNFMVYYTHMRAYQAAVDAKKKRSASNPIPFPTIRISKQFPIIKTTRNVFTRKSNKIESHDGSQDSIPVRKYGVRDSMRMSASDVSRGSTLNSYLAERSVRGSSLTASPSRTSGFSPGSMFKRRSTDIARASSSMSVHPSESNVSDSVVKSEQPPKPDTDGPKSKSTSKHIKF